MPASRVRFRILGGVELWLDDAPAALPRPRHRAVLGCLLLNANRVVTVSALTEALWGGAAPATARNQLQADISAIRRTGRGAITITTRAAGYVLHADADQADHLRFAALTARARAATVAERVPLLREALALWHGPALADAAGAYVAAARLQLGEERLAALEDLYEAELESGRHREIVPDLTGAARDEPTRERLWVTLMLALHRCGRRADALAAGRELRRFLADEHGLAPGPAFQETERLILRSGDESGTDAEDAGAVVPALLPPDIVDFTGRDREVARLGTALAPIGRPLPVVTITGMGGVGKTTLAVHAAHRAAGDYPGGQLYATLRGTDAAPAEPGDVLARFLRALGVDERAIPIDLTERADAYRSRMAGRRVLVLLDDAADEAQIRPLLPGDGSCVALVTSRAGLDGLEGARRVQLGVFSDDEAASLLGQVAAPQRVAREPAESATILRLCGRLPLAVRIAGARLRSRPAWPMSRLATALQNEQRRLDHLVAGDLAVRTSLASSYRAIGAAGQLLARRLSLFTVPDFPSWLAAAVAGVSAAEAEDLLERLVDAHLLLDAGTGATGAGRYRFHDLVRLYLRERAQTEEPSEGTDVLRAGFGAYLGLARRMATLIPGPCYAAIHGSFPAVPSDGLDGVDPIEWFAAERLALLAVVRHACDTGEIEAAFDLAGCMEKYFDIRGIYIDWRATSDYVLAACRAAGHRLGEAVMLRGLTELAAWHEVDHPGGAMDRMLADAEQTAELFASVGHGPGLSDAAVMKAWALAAKGAYGEAASAADLAIRLAEEHDHLGGQARAHVAAAVVHGESLNLAVAEHHLTVALRVAREVGNQRYVATVLQFIGVLNTRAGRPDVAITALDESLRVLRTYQDRYAEVLTLLTLARAHLPGPSSRGYATEALTIAREYNLPHHTADALGVLGAVELADGNHRRAVDHLSASVQLWRQRGWGAFLADALRTLGDAQAPDSPQAALDAWREAREIYVSLGHAPHVAELDALISKQAAPSPSP
ncbi:DNA-binding SARP family transcriptional activator [Catenuloplanes nepalensis]|uniref:DNA-binding SARP family transcriptional activator n=1 Tax=Catenuloplanes nepalensis TaxID=587533 RepID=A0ABT9MNY9_9ACTN|nr:BTAD domain-containing putative transcriptional regulator [Catenuloplanes nepalensis]MDP9792771.1 DNA-binding SARP family transcriptional activator [Catenuloplanes nepalensis]